MRVGVIRGDLPGPVFLGDLEPTSQLDFSIEQVGQTRYVSYPNLTAFGTVLATIPATIASTGAITFPLTVSGSNDTLRLRAAASGAFTVATIAHASYSTLTTLLAAVNAALATAGLAITAQAATTANEMAFATTASFGPGAAISLDTNGNGSNADASLGFSTSGATFTMPAAATILNALLPVGGPLDVSQATIFTNVGAGLTTAQVKKVADAIAPQFVESNVAIQSFKAGNLHGLLSSSFNPDPNRRPALNSGAAITVVQDDGHTVFSVGLPHISSAASNTPNAGDVTITGTDLGNTEQDLDTIKFTGAVAKSISQKLLTHTNTGGTQGSVSATSIVIPASLIPGAVAATSSVQVKYGSFASNVVALS